MEKHPTFYHHGKSRHKARKKHPTYLVSYNHPLIVKLHTSINKFGILSILEPLGLQSISSRVILNLWIFYVTHSGIKIHVPCASLFVPLHIPMISTSGEFTYNEWVQGSKTAHYYVLPPLCISAWTWRTSKWQSLWFSIANKISQQNPPLIQRLNWNWNVYVKLEVVTLPN